MLAMFARRILFLMPVLLGGSAIVFTLIHMAPGDPVDAMLGIYASPEARAALRARYGLNDPLVYQYFSWLGMVLTGDWGTSLQQHVPVLPLVIEKFWITLILTAAATFFAGLVGITTGIVAAVKQNTWIDRLLLLVTVFAISMPPYWLGLAAIFVFSVQLHWLPTGGLYDFSGQRSIGNLLVHLVMPAVVAGLTPAAIISRVTRSAMLEIMRLDFLTALRAKGVGERAVILGHVFRNALPTVVSMTGLQIGYLMLGAALFVEIIFSWPGLGLEIYKSVVGRDMPMLLGLVLFSTFIFVVLNLVVDIIYRLINPRVRDA
jgi:peptide/nickel transport system permease protein